MKKKNNAKELLINCLQNHCGEDLKRNTILEQTGLSSSRLSELIKELRLEGYSIITPNRSGIVRLEGASSITPGITSKEVRQWLIILALSKSGKSTYVEIISTLLSIADSSYIYDEIYTEKNYSDMDILDYLSANNPSAMADIEQFLPLPTLRKDLHSLIDAGVVDQQREYFKGHARVVYSLSEKAPVLLFESDEELYDFMSFFDNFKSSLSNREPLENIYRKASDIYDWESYDSVTQIYGKSAFISAPQLDHLKRFVQYAYKAKTLQIDYGASDQRMTLSINSGLLFYSVETNCFYLLCKNTAVNNVMQLRLDRIISIIEKNDRNTDYRSDEFLRIYEEMFSASFDGEKQHVKVLFQDFGNIRERLNALHRKRKFSRLYDINPLSSDIPHSIMYEDDLIGLTAFARYLRSFGRSALALEPQDLRNLMIDSNNKTLQNYEV